MRGCGREDAERNVCDHIEMRQIGIGIGLGLYLLPGCNELLNTRCSGFEEDDEQ